MKLLTPILSASLLLPSAPSVAGTPGRIESPACREFVRFVRDDMNTFGLVVLKDGKHVLEYYGHGADPETKFKLWSISKTFTGLMLGALVKERKLTLDDRLVDHVPEFATPTALELRTGVSERRNQLTLRHLWTFSSGLDWCEYATCSPLSPLRVHYGLERRDGADYVTKHNLVHPPGEVFAYGTGNSLLLQHALRTVSEKERPGSYADLPVRTILGPLGISNWAFEQDDTGLYMGGSGLFLTTRGLSKLGQLILNRGKLPSGRELVDEAFYREMVTPSQGIQGPATPQTTKDWEGAVGGSIWMNRKLPGISQFFRTAPEDLVYSGGNFGQFLLVFPSAKLVIARNGGDADHARFWEPFTNRALACFAPAQLTPDNGKPDHKTPGTGAMAYGKFLFRAVNERFLVNMYAQENCNCLFTQGISDPKACRTLYPLQAGLGALLPRITVDRAAGKVEAYTTLGALIGSSATAQFDPTQPTRGCRLTKRARPAL